MTAEQGAAARYDVSGEIDPASSQGMLLALVDDGASVLDVGCASGYLARELGARGCQVVGIEYDPALAAQAREHCVEVIQGDLETMEIKDVLGERTFDTVVCGDILEHLRNPERVLEQLRRQLGPRGYLVVSVPNVAHGSVRLALLTGKFSYTGTGLLDSTHVRFYTAQTLQEMLAAGGFTVVHLAPVLLGVGDSEVQPDPQIAIPEPALRFVDSDPDAVAYQYVALAYPTDRVSGGQGLAPLLHRLRGESAELALLREGRERELCEAAERVETAYAQLLAARDDLVRRDEELLQAQRDLQDGQHELATERAELRAVRAELDRALAERDAARAAYQALSSSPFGILARIVRRIARAARAR